jgi:folate-binding protein YgfZ
MAGFVPLNQLGALRLEGPDARKFLHGQCTQEVKSRAPGEGGYAFLLDPRGRNLGDFRFLVRPDGILCVLDKRRVEPTRAWLDRFVIAADVRIADVSAEWAGIALAGPGSPEVARRIAGAAPPAREGDAAIGRFRDRELLLVASGDLGPGGVEAWVLGPGAQAVIHALAIELAPAGAAPLTQSGAEALRIEAGRPRFGVDVDESVLPEETGQGSRAVSYTKGCYSGQEVVAKQKYLGKPRKMLAGAFPARVLRVPAPLFSGDAEAGVLTSCAHSPALGRPVALAMLKAPVPEPGSVLRAPSDGGDADVVVASLPLSVPS